MYLDQKSPRYVGGILEMLGVFIGEEDAVSDGVPPQPFAAPHRAGRLFIKSLHDFP